MTFGQLKEKIRFRVGNRSDIDQLIADNINRAYIDIATREKFTAGGKIFAFPEHLYFPTLIKNAELTLTTNIQKYALASDFAWMITMKNKTQDVPVALKTLKQFYLFIDKPDKGIPTMACVVNQDVYFYPIPNQSYSMIYWYKKRPALLSSDNDTPELPQEWHEAIFLLASAMTFYDLLEEVRGDRHMALLENWLIEHLGQESVYLSSVKSTSV